MDSATLLLLFTATLLLIFGVIVVRVYRRGNKEVGERPKYRIFDDEDPKP